MMVLFTSLLNTGVPRFATQSVPGQVSQVGGIVTQTLIYNQYCVPVINASRGCTSMVFGPFHT